jgi:hypothetical protein
MVERGERMGLAAAELRDQREDRCGVRGLAIEPAQHHSNVFSESACEAGTREELDRIAIVFGRFARDHLLKRDRKLIRIERAAGADLRAGLNDFVPRFHASKANPMAYISSLLELGQSHCPGWRWS